MFKPFLFSNKKINQLISNNPAFLALLKVENQPINLYFIPFF